MDNKKVPNGQISWFLGAVLGGISALVVVAIDFIGSIAAGLPIAAFTLFDWFARALPGNIITIFIQSMVAAITRLRLGQTSSVAKLVEQGSAILMFLLIGVVFGIVLALVGRGRRFDLRRLGLIGGAILSVVFILLMATLGFPEGNPYLDSLWVLVTFAIWGWLLGETMRQIVTPAKDATIDGASRRRFLWIAGAGSLTVLVTAAGIRILSNPSSIPITGGAPAPPTKSPELDLANASNTSGPAQSPQQADLLSRFPPVPGTRPELTSNDQFYRIDINTIPPSIDGNTWQLDLGGLIDKPAKLSLQDIRSRPATRQAITLECISNPLGGDLTSSTVYTGASLKKLLQDAGLQSGVKAVNFESADGFYESVPIEEAMDERTLLVYAMNDQPLPEEHGYPLRIYIPNHFGMKQPKWILKMTVSDQPVTGYWVERGWNEKAVPPVTSVIDAVDVQDRDKQSGMVPVGGIAFAGARGIKMVEVQVDNGPWNPAELRTPPLSPLTWVQWRYLWQAQPGAHTIKVRATDGDGTLQTTTVAPPEPDGATGIYSVKQDIS